MNRRTRLLKGLLTTAALATSATVLNTAWAKPMGADAHNEVANNQGEAASMQALPKALRSLVASPSEVKHTFDSGVPGVKGWVLVNPAKPLESHIMYTFGDGQYAIAGTLLSVNEKDELISLTQLHKEEYRYEPDLSDFWQLVESSHWVADGAQVNQAANTVYGFFDANCIYCHLAWLALEPYMEKGLQVRWIPVGILGETSGQKAAAIFQSDDVRAVMKAGHTQWETSRDKAFPVGELTAEVQQKLQQNLELMLQMGMNGTPGFVSKDKEGKVRVIPGMPPLPQIPDMVGMEPIENSNPKLDRFR